MSAVLGLSAPAGCDDVEFPGLFVLIGPDDSEGDPIMLADFFRANPELNEYERNACATLARGEFLSFGGGAAPVFTLKRVS